MDTARQSPSSKANRKVLHIVNGEVFAGAERVQDLLAQSLPPHGWDVSFACLKSGQFPGRRSSSSPLEVFAMSSKLDFTVASRIADWARATGIELVHSHTPRSGLVARLVARKLRLPWVHHVHSPTARDTESPVRNLVNAAMERYGILGAADRLICVSDSLTPELRVQGVPPSRIRTVHNGVAIQAAPKPWAWPDDRPWVLGMVALFRPRKGLELLLQALSLVGDGAPPWELHLIGGFETADYERSIRQLVTDLGLEARVRWLGFVSDVATRLRALDLMVLPSLYGEGMPMVLLEAMALGIPVVASDVEGVAVALDEGRCGRLVGAGNPHFLARALESIFARLPDLASVVTLARQRQIDMFSDTAMAKATAAVYAEACAAHSGLGQ